MKKYESIPFSGVHYAGAQTTEEKDTGTEVRAPAAPDERKAEQAGQFRLTRSSEGNRLVLRRWEEGSAMDEGFEEIGRYARADLGGKVTEFAEQHRYMVFENSRTGEVHVQQQADVSGSLFDDDRYDAVSFFDSEEAASAYAEQRQRP